MRRIITAVFLVAATLTLCARDISVQVSPTRLSVLPGAPMDVTVTVTNKAGHDLFVLADSLRHGVHIAGYLYTSDGTKVDCWKESVSWVSGHSPPSTWPKCRFPAGGTLTVPSGIYSHTACPLSQIPPGRYEGRIVVTANILIGEQDRTISSEVRVPVEVRQPTGQDAAYLKALQDALRTYESQAGPVKLKGVPLTWREVLSSFRIHSAQIALTRFPTSTYAGYALAKKIPDYSNPLFKPVPPAKQVKMAYEEGKTYVTFPDKAFEKYFQQLDAFMKGDHVPKSLRTVLWSFYGDQLVRRGRFTEAKEAFMEATKGAPPLGAKGSAYYNRAKGFIEAFKAEKPSRTRPKRPG